MRVRKSDDKAFTIPELLISLFIVSLVTSMLFTVAVLLNTQAYNTEAVISARYTLQFLLKRLDAAFDQTTADGLHVAADNESFCIQAIDGLSLDGTRAWSPFVTFFFFDREERRVLQGQVELAEIGEVHQPKLPTHLTDEALEQMIALRRADGKLKPVSTDIDDFKISHPNALSAKVEITLVLKSGRYKDERVKDERLFFFSSAADL